MEFDYRRGFEVYPGETQPDKGAKAPYIDHGTNRIDPQRYLSREEADLEWDRMWTRTWTFAGITHDIPQVGDYFKLELGPESFIIVRTGQGEEDIAAYYNVCPHRGNRIAHSDFGSAGSDNCFQCDFHGWRFALDGSNARIRDEMLFRPEAIAHRPGLTGVNCAVWNSLVFINMDPNPAKSLREQLGIIPDHLAVFHIEKYRVMSDVEILWDANWKTALDAFQEFLHADDVHPEVFSMVDTLENQYDLYENGNARMIIPNGYVSRRHEDRDTVSEELKSFLRFYGGDPDNYAHLKGYEYRRALIEVKRAWGRRHGYDHFDQLTDGQIVDNWNYYLFPNITLGMFSDQMVIQSFRPHATDHQKSYYRIISMNLPVGGTDEMVMDSSAFGPSALSEPGWDGSVRPPVSRPTEIEDIGALVAQDVRRVPEVQKGLRSRAYRGYVLSEFEIRIRHYLAELDRYLGRR